MNLSPAEEKIIETVTADNIDEFVGKVEKELLAKGNYPMKHIYMVAQPNSSLDNLYAHFKRDPKLLRVAMKSKGGLKIMSKIFFG